MRIPVLARTAGLGAAALAVLGLAAGCSSIEPDTATSDPAAATGEASATDSSQGEQDEQEAAATPAFGSATQWDGLDVTVSQPVAFTPSNFASYPEGAKRFVAVDITIHNTSDELLQTMWFTTSATSGDLSGFVIDSDKGIGSPTTGIQPDQSLTWKEAYPMGEGPMDLQLSWHPPDTEAQTAALTLSSFPTPAPTGTASGTGTASSSPDQTDTSTGEAEPGAEATTEVTNTQPAG